MSTDNPPAVNKIELDNVIHERLRQLALSHLPESLDVKASKIRDAILESGILHAYAERVSLHAGFAAATEALENGKREGRAELQAAIEALCEEVEDGYPNGWTATVTTRRLRALLADNGAGLRKVKERAWDECADYCWRELGVRPDESMNPYRDTAQEASDE